MGDLFDQLKSAGPINKNDETLNKTSSTSSIHDKNVEMFNAAHKSKSSSGNRRDSMPPPATSNIVRKNKGHKARSLSPPKFGVENVIKSLKVKLERKKLEEFLSRPLDEHANNIRVKHDKLVARQPKKMTPTKAQQKLFEPSMGGQKKTKAQMLRDFNVKPCKVRIHRDNLQQLLRDFRSKKNSKKLSKESKTSGHKRPASSFSGSPPSKKGKFSSSSASTKSKSNFFIKLNTSPTSKLEKKLKNMSKSSSAVAHHNKIKNSKSTTTTPTKFSRSQLIRSFGERFFNVHVKIERCTHPLMLTFESNDRARRLQAKRNNKSKNLSVSFREQVEIFGGSSSDTDDSFDEDFCAVPNRSPRKTTSKSAPATPVVTPARLKKVENGKVVDDIELDPSLFVDPSTLVASTPFSPGRKKRDHKSFSPLKDECSPSPRKEQLKLANEKIPPSGFRRLNIEEDDDEDDDCEYIVPIEMPQRRTSRTSSNTTLEGVVSTSMPLAESTANASAMLTDSNEDLAVETNNIDDNIDLTGDLNSIDESRNNANNQPENISDDSFQSANDDGVVTEKNAAISVAVAESEKLPALTSLQTPTLEFNDALGMAEEEEATTPIESYRNSPPKNGVCEGDTNENDVDFNTSSKQMNTMDDLSMNLFMDDSQSNENDNHTKSFVDSLINETIDKLTKDIDESTSDEQFAT